MTHPIDQAEPTMPPVAFQMKRIGTMLHWIDEHYHSARHHQKEGNARAEERELRYLEDAIEQARAHFERLKELL